MFAGQHIGKDTNEQDNFKTSTGKSELQKDIFYKITKNLGNL